MFISTTLKNSNQDVLSSYFSTGSDGQNNNNYSLSFPYRLIFTGINTGDVNNYFSNCYVTPDAALYVQNNKKEAEKHLAKASLHNHDFFEIMFVLDGKIYVNIENERHLYTKGSCYIVNTNVKHTEEYSSDFNVVFIQISKELMEYLYRGLKLNYFATEKRETSTDMNHFLLSNLYEDKLLNKDYVDFIPIDNDEDIISRLRLYFDQITKETLTPMRGSTLNTVYILQKILLFLSDTNCFSTVPVEIGTKIEHLLFKQISSAMQKTNGRISRQKLSEELNYSGAYLNEICKKYSGLSLFDYGMTFCMKKAAYLLLSEKSTISDIAAELGFSNRTHFYKIFKSKYGMNPAEYRKKICKERM